MKQPTLTSDHFNRFGNDFFPEHLGIRILEVKAGRLTAEFTIQKYLMAPNGYLHAGSVVSLADTAAGYACVAHLPDGAEGFTTVELKTNFLATARAGDVQCVATAVHLGKSTQVWDAEVVSRESGKTMALFRCTQMILYPKKTRSD